MPHHYRPNTVFESLSQAREDRERARDEEDNRTRNRRRQREQINYSTQSVEPINTRYSTMQIVYTASSNYPNSMLDYAVNYQHSYEEWYRRFVSNITNYVPVYNTVPELEPEPEIDVNELKVKYHHTDSVPDGLVF